MGFKSLFSIDFPEPSNTEKGLQLSITEINVCDDSLCLTFSAKKKIELSKCQKFRNDRGVIGFEKLWFAIPNV